MYDYSELEASVLIKCENCGDETPHVLRYIVEGEVAAECTECTFVHYIRVTEVFYV